MISNAFLGPFTPSQSRNSPVPVVFDSPPYSVLLRLRCSIFLYWRVKTVQNNLHLNRFPQGSLGSLGNEELLCVCEQDSYAGVIISLR